MEFWYPCHSLSSRFCSFCSAQQEYWYPGIPVTLTFAAGLHACLNIGMVRPVHCLTFACLALQSLWRICHLRALLIFVQANSHGCTNAKRNVSTENGREFFMIDWWARCPTTTHHICIEQCTSTLASSTNLRDICVRVVGFKLRTTTNMYTHNSITSPACCVLLGSSFAQQKKCTHINQ